MAAGSRQPRLLKQVLPALICALFGCADDGPKMGDSSLDLPGAFERTVGERGPPLVDFLVQGCDELSEGQCKGDVPLVLTFTALLQSEPSSVSWDLGDSSEPATGFVVTHTYEKPGTYDVTLTAGARGGTTSERKEAFVAAGKAGAGGACNADDVCRSGTCICSEPGSCPFPLSSGLCLEACEIQCTDKSTVCIDLTPKSGRSTAAPWQTRLCLPRCTKEADCVRPGFSCKLAPWVFSWQKTCVPWILRFVGEPCRDATGTPEPALCLGAMCLDIGASGYCSWPCTAGSCPEGTRCVKYQGSDVPVCLLRCTTGSCESDPLLRCEPPGGSSAYSFQVLGTPEPKGTTFCSVRRCSDDGVCGMMGTCDKSLGGHCVPGGR